MLSFLNIFLRKRFKNFYQNNRTKKEVNNYLSTSFYIFNNYF